MIIEQLKEAGLKGRGGAGFPTGIKWEAVKNAPGEKKYVICNVSEGEPGVTKDGWLLAHHADTVVEGVALAMKEVGASKGYLYLRKDYFDKYKDAFKKIIGDRAIELFREPCGYLGGEETTLLEVIEGKRAEPRFKPPFPTTNGLFDSPTLINNCETFYYAALVAAGNYKKTRLYSLSGAIHHQGVYELPENMPIAQVLKETKNYPAFDFFVQAGGGASGTILTQDELEAPLSGAGSIIVFDKKKTKAIELMRKWAGFFIEENCGKCVPCREGVYRLNELVRQPALDIERVKEIVASLKETSYCPFGKGVANSFDSLLTKIWNQSNQKK